MDDPSGLKGSEDQASKRASPRPHLNFRGTIFTPTPSRVPSTHVHERPRSAQTPDLALQNLGSAGSGRREIPSQRSTAAFHLPVGSLPPAHSSEAVMKLGRSLIELATEIQRQAQSKADFIANTRQLQILEDGKTLALESQGEFSVTDLALSQIGERVGIPTKYLRKMQEEAPKLLATNVNHWFGEQPETRMVRTLDSNSRAFLSNRYMRVDNYDVTETALPVLLNTAGLRIVSCEVTENRLYIKAVTDRVQREVKSRQVGDVVEAGVMISNSEVGLGSVLVSPLPTSCSAPMAWFGKVASGGTTSAGTPTRRTRSMPFSATRPAKPTTRPCSSR